MRVIIWCLILLFCLPAAATEYPWETKAESGGASPSSPKATPKKAVKILKFGPYIVDQQKNWQRRIDPEEGEMLVLLENEEVEAAIIFKETMTDTDHDELEPKLIELVTHIDRTYVQVAGMKDVMCLRDVSDDGKTLFHIYPYNDNDTMYWLVVVDKEDRTELRPEVMRMLNGFRLKQ